MQLWDSRRHAVKQSGASQSTRRTSFSLRRFAAIFAAGGLLTAAAWPIQQSASGTSQNSSAATATADQSVSTSSAQPAEKSAATSLTATGANRPSLLREQSAELLKAAKDLQAEVDKTDEGALSVAVIRKADEIDKLTRTMKDKHNLADATK